MVVTAISISELQLQLQLQLQLELKLENYSLPLEGMQQQNTSWTRHQVVFTVFKEIVQLKFYSKKVKPSVSI